MFAGWNIEQWQVAALILKARQLTADNELADYEAANVALDAIDKSIAEVPRPLPDNPEGYYCPICFCTLVKKKADAKYYCCHVCGQRLDWDGVYGKSCEK